MNKPQLLLLAIISLTLAQKCQVVSNLESIYPTSDEVYQMNLNEVFSGSNLTFNVSGSDASVKNYFQGQAQDLASDLSLQGNAILQNQNTLEWSGEAAFVGKTQNQALVYPFNTVTQEQGRPIPLLQSSAPLSCTDLTFIRSGEVIVDCYQVENGLIENYFQLVDLQAPQQIPLIIQNPQNIVQLIPGQFHRQVKYWQNQTSGQGYLFRATYFQDLKTQGVLEVFILKDGVPSTNQSYILNTTTFGSNISVSDFDITPAGQLFVLNITENILYFDISEEGTLVNTGKDLVSLSKEQQLLGLSIGLDYRVQVNNTLSVLIATDQKVYNVFEYLYISTHEPILSGYYSVPQLINRGYPYQIDQNNQYVMVQDQQTTYFFNRGVSIIQPLDYRPFYEGEVHFSLADSVYSALNQFPNNVYQISKTQISTGTVQQAQLVGQFTSNSNGTIKVQANSTKNGLVQTCSINLYFQVVQSNDVNLYKAGEYSLPNSVMFPLNETFNLNQLFSGPVVEASGQVSQQNNMNGKMALIQPINKESTGFLGMNKQVQVNATYSNTTKIVSDTIEVVDLQTPSYPTNGSNLVKNSYDASTQTLLQLILINTTMSGYICEDADGEGDLTCHSLGQNYQIFPNSTNQIEVLYPPSGLPRAYYIVNKNQSSLNIFEVQWSRMNPEQGSISTLKYTLDFSYNNYTLNFTSFTVIGDRLYVVLGEINQIWGYALGEDKPRLALRISSLELPQVGSVFMPIAVTGNYDQLGPILFINNQFQVVIVSVLNDQPTFLNATTYPQQLSNELSFLNVIGESMIITQYQASQQQGAPSVALITQYSLSNLLAPTVIKSLPLYGQQLQNPPQVQSDALFLYVLLSSGSLNVYNPRQPEHNCLYQQINMTTGVQLVYFSPAASEQVSFVALSSSQQLLNFELNSVPELVIVPGQYGNAYTTELNYTVTVTGGLSGQSRQASSPMTVFNSQLGITVDIQQIESSNDNLVVSHTGETQFNLDFSDAVQGGVADYSIFCVLCETGNIKLRNYINKNDSTIGDLTGVQQIVSNPVNHTAYVVTQYGVFQVNQSYESELVFQFAVPQTNCTAASYNQITDQLVIVCQETPTSIYVSITTFANDNQTNTTTQTYTVNGYNTVSDVEIVGVNVFIRGVNFALDQDPFLYVFQFSDVMTLTYNFSCPYNKGINDFSTIVYNAVPVVQSSLHYLLVMYTCESTQEAMYTGGSLDNGMLVLNETAQMMPTVSNYSILANAQYLQLLPLSANSTDLEVLLTTSTRMSLMLSYKISESNPTSVTLSTYTVQGTIPPYGQFTLQNKATLANGILVLPYSLQQTESNLIVEFVAVYDLNRAPTSSNVYLMLGGVYNYLTPNQSPASIYTLLTLSNQEQLILTANQELNFNLTSISIESQLELIIQVDQSFPQQDVIVSAQNYYTKQQFPLQVKYDTHRTDTSSGLKWWAWMLIVIAVLIVVAGVAIGVMKCRNQQQNQPLLS